MPSQDLIDAVGVISYLVTTCLVVISIRRATSPAAPADSPVEVRCDASRAGRQQGQRMTAPVFVRRCAVCGYEVREEWGPETHTIAHERLIHHVNNQHTDAEIRAWALPLIVGRAS